jgi:TMEM175 potassium channel family protein
MSKSRLEAFSDGVFAIAITLLVLTIAPPSDYRNLGHQLTSEWPALAAFVVSFAVIGIMWLNHHSVFSHFEHVDRGLIYLNMLLLMTITFLPYPTGVLGHALAKGENARTAAVIYAVVMALNAWVWTALWLYGSHRRRLLRPGFPEAERSTATRMFSIGVVMYTLSIGVAFWNAAAFLAVQALFALYYAIDPISRRPQRVRRGGRATSGVLTGDGTAFDTGQAEGGLIGRPGDGGFSGGADGEGQFGGSEPGS